MNPQIILAGCSFTESARGQGPNKWIPWSDFLYYDFFSDKLDVLNIGQSSAGQLLISEKIVKAVLNPNRDIKLVVIQWSAVGRGYHEKDSDYLSRFIHAMNNKEPHTLIDSSEFINVKNLNNGEVTSIVNQVSNKFYESSLIRIYLTHQFLKNNNIPYISFWGWQQITDNQNELSDLIKRVHDENFWTFGNYGGLNEYCIDKIGEKRAIVPGDFHPTTEAHTLFYKEVIKPKILELGFGEQQKYL